MERIAIWVVNGALFVLCCYLAASAINLVSAEALAPSPGEAAAPSAAPAATPRTWQDRQVILSRNLFNVSTLAAPLASAPEEEELEETKLPLRLLGTAASNQPALSWAAIVDREKQQHRVVRVDDEILGATVVAVERGRIILENRGRREELLLEEDHVPGMRRRVPPRGAARAGRRGAAALTGVGDLSERVRQLAERQARAAAEARQGAAAEARQGAAAGADATGGDSGEAVARSAAVARNAATLFSQARILPKYEDGEMVGVQLSNVKPGSLFEKIGIQNGDVITEFNGIAIDSPQQSADVLRELTEADRFEIVVTGTDNRQRTLNYAVED